MFRRVVDTCGWPMHRDKVEEKVLSFGMNKREMDIVVEETLYPWIRNLIGHRLCISPLVTRGHQHKPYPFDFPFLHTS